MPQVELTQFRETYGAAAHTEEELVLIERLVRRQGVSREEADLLVERHKQGQRAEIDPALMEGLDTL
jgi:hypothetical protein